MEGHTDGPTSGTTWWRFFILHVDWQFISLRKRHGRADGPTSKDETMHLKRVRRSLVTVKMLLLAYLQRSLYNLQQIKLSFKLNSNESSSVSDHAPFFNGVTSHQYVINHWEPVNPSFGSSVGRLGLSCSHNEDWYLFCSIYLFTCVQLVLSLQLLRCKSPYIRLRVLGLIACNF